MRPTNEVRRAELTVHSVGGPPFHETAITLDGVPIPMPFGIWRGYNVVSIDPVSGLVTTARFDVLGWGTMADSFVDFLASQPEGNVLAIAVADEGSMNLSPAALAACRALGAHHLDGLQFRQPWAFITIKGRPELLLQEATSATDRASATAVIELPALSGSKIVSATSWFNQSWQGTPETGMAVSVVDPVTGASVDHAFAFHDMASFVSLVDAVPDGHVVSFAVRGGVDLSPGAAALRALGAVRPETVPPGSPYVLIGRKGALPGSMAELRVRGTAIGLSLPLDRCGGWSPGLFGMLYPELDFGGRPVGLSGDTRGELVGNSLWLAPGTGATVAPGPGARGIDLWGPTSDLFAGQPPGPVTISLWPTAGRPARHRTFLQYRDAPGHYLTSAGPMAPLDRTQVLRAHDAVQIVRRGLVAPGRWDVQIDGELPPDGGTAWTRGTLMTGIGSELVYRPVAEGTVVVGLVLDDEGDGAFSLSRAGALDTWVSRSDLNFRADHDGRQIFQETFRLADAGPPGAALRVGEGVGPLQPGDVALHTGTGFRGDAWVVSGDLTRFADLVAADGAPPPVESLRRGPHTTVRLFRGAGFTGESFTVDRDLSTVPDSWRSHIGSIQLLRLAQPSGQPMDVSVVLSDDFHLAPDGTLTETVVYRTTLTLPPNVAMVEIRATDDTTVTVGPDTYPVGPDHGAVVRPNAVRRLVVTSDATALGTTGLRFRTDTMRTDEWFPVFPDRFVHTDLATLQEADADTSASFGTAGLDPHGQRALGHVMGAIAYADVDTVIGPAHGRAVSAAAMTNPGWRLTLPDPTKRSPADFAHLTTDAELEAAIAGAADGDDADGDGDDGDGDDGNGRRRAPGNGRWDAVIGGSHQLTTVIVHKVAANPGSSPLRVVIGYVEAGAATAVSFALHTVERLVQLGHTVVQHIGADVRAILAVLKLDFSWADVLRAQRRISGAVSAVLATAPARIEALRPALHQFISERKARVVSAIDSKIAEYGTAHTSTTALVPADRVTAQHKRAVHEASEKSHWLLAKLADHHATAPAGAAPALRPAPASFGGLLDAVRTQVSDDPTVNDALAKAGEALHQAVADPAAAPLFLLDAFLQVAKAAIVAGLDVIDALGQALLAALADAVAMLDALLTDAWELPFVGALWRWLSRTLPADGPPESLNAVNVVALIGALPATVASRLVTGDVLFAGAPQRRADPGERRDTTEPATATEPAHDPAHDPEAQLRRDWAFAAGGLSLAASILTSVLDIQIVSVPVTGGAHPQLRQVGGAGHEWRDADGVQHRLVPWLDMQNRNALATSLELITLGLSLATTVAAHPGGYPTAPFDVGQGTWSETPAEHWEGATWIYDMCAFIFDLVFLVLPGHSMARRGPVAGLAVATLRGMVDLGLVLTISIETGLHGDAATIRELPVRTAGGVIGALPGVLPWLRFPPLVAASDGLTVIGLAVADLDFGVTANMLAFVMAAAE